MSSYQVTYFNAELQRKCVLIDEIDMETAAKVLLKFGNKNEPNYYMGPETRIEPMPAAEVSQ